MNNDQTNPPDSLPDFSAISESVGEKVRAHQRKIRLLTGAAFLLGFLAVATSFFIVSGYFVLYRPKEKEVLRQVTLAAQRAKAEPAPSDNAAPPAARLPFDFPSVQATMTFLHSIAIASLGAAIGILALGTLVLLAVVILNRRVTLRQVNASLAQISAQLKEIELKTAKP